MLRHARRAYGVPPLDVKFAPNVPNGSRTQAYAPAGHASGAAQAQRGRCLPIGSGRAHAGRRDASSGPVVALAAPPPPDCPSHLPPRHTCVAYHRRRAPEQEAGSEARGSACVTRGRRWVIATMGRRGMGQSGTGQRGMRRRAHSATHTAAAAALCCAHLVRLCHGLELNLRRVAILGILVRVVLDRKLVIGALDLSTRRRLRHVAARRAAVHPHTHGAAWP